MSQHVWHRCVYRWMAVVLVALGLVAGSAADACALTCAPPMVSTGHACCAQGTQETTAPRHPQAVGRPPQHCASDSPAATLRAGSSGPAVSVARTAIDSVANTACTPAMAMCHPAQSTTAAAPTTDDASDASFSAPLVALGTVPFTRLPTQRHILPGQPVSHASALFDPLIPSLRV